MWRYRNFYYFLRINVHASNFHTFESLRATFQHQNKIEYIKLLKNINEFIETEKSKPENKAYKLLNVIYNKQTTHGIKKNTVKSLRNFLSITAMTIMPNIIYYVKRHLKFNFQSDKN